MKQNKGYYEALVSTGLFYITSFLLKDHISNIVIYMIACCVYFLSYFSLDHLNKYSKEKIVNSKYVDGFICVSFLVWCGITYWLSKSLYMTNIYFRVEYEPIFWILTIGLFAVIYSSMGQLKVDDKKNRIIPTVTFVFLTAIITYAPNTFQNNVEWGLYHIHAYENSIINALNGIPYDNINCSIYGHYGIFYILPVKILNLLHIDNLQAIAIVIGMITFISVCSFYYVISYLISSNILYYLFMLASGVAGFSLYYPGQYFQGYPHRILFPMVILAIYVFGIKRNKNVLPLEYLMAMLSIIWNFETGIVCLLALIAVSYCKNVSIDSMKTNKGIFLLVKKALITIVVFFMAYGLVNIYDIITGGTLESIKQFIYPIASDQYSIEDLELGQEGFFNTWIFVIGSFLFCVSYSVRACIIKCRHISYKLEVAFMTSIIGLGCAVYYINRAAHTNLSICLFEIIIVMACWIDYITKKPDAIKPKYIKLIQYVIVLVCCGWTIETCVNSGKIIQNRKNTVWNYESLYNFAYNTMNEVPESSMGMGMGVPELFTITGYDTKLHITDWSDMTNENIDYINQQLEEYEYIFVNQDVPNIITKINDEYELVNEYEYKYNFGSESYLFGLYRRKE